MFGVTQGPYMALGMPDVCKTPIPVGPPVPIPYPNIAMGTMGIPSQMKVFWGGAPVHTLATKIAMSSGDNAGVAGGVASAKVMGPCTPMTGAMTCLVAGAPVARMTSVTSQNGTNCPGSILNPSQLKCLVLAP